MEQIPTPKKERKLLKAIVRVAGVLVQELALGLGRKYIGKMINKIKIPKKRETLSFLLLLSCTIAFAQYPATGNKQRLGYQTTGDGLVFRGRSNDTMALKPSTLNNAYHIFDTVNNVLFSYIKTKGGWKFNNADTVIVNNVTDTTSLSNRINLKINISDTASMLTNYLRTGVAASTYTPLTRSISTTAPLQGGGDLSANRTFSITQASGSVNGFLSSTDWTTFNGKGSGTVTSVAMTVPTFLSVSGSPVTSSGTLAVSLSGSALPIANGGTGATSASAARTALGATVRGANTFLLTDIGAISFLRYNADNTVSQRAADGMRSDLGGTTIGQSMFTLTNPSAITFPRFNADNTLTALDAASFRTAIGAGTGTGTVTSVTGSLPISSSGGTTPNITIANAAVSTTGVVTASTQTFGGAKTFNGVLNASSDLNVTGLSALTGGATIGTMATNSSLTHVIGVNTSNAIGELVVGDGIKILSGFLGLNLIQILTIGTDFVNTSAQSSTDLTFTLTGASVGDPVLLGVPNGSAPANTNYTAWVSATNTVTVRFNNYSAISVNPNAGDFTIRVLKL
jgi:hypothetical protein